MSSHIPHVIAYHKISPHQDIGINRVHPEKFEDQINIILDCGYDPVTFSQLVYEVKPVKNPLVITFDDGYESVYQNAFPILKKHNIPAVVFVISNFVGDINNWESFSIQRRFRHLTHNQIIDLHKSGWEIGSHSKNHPYLPALPEQKIKDEIRGSKEFIEDIIQDRVISFCYPYGRYNQQIIKVVKDAGYIYATCNVRLFKNEVTAWNLERRSIYYTDTEASFKQKLKHSRKQLDFSLLKEWIIQRGTIPGVAVNKFHNLKY